MAAMGVMRSLERHLCPCVRSETRCPPVVAAAPTAAGGVPDFDRLHTAAAPLGRPSDSGGQNDHSQRDPQVGLSSNVALYDPLTHTLYHKH